MNSLEDEVDGLYRSHWWRLVRRSRSVVECRFIAEEIAQDAFLRWIDMLQGRHRPLAPNLGLLYRIVHGLSVDSVRVGHRRRHLLRSHRSDNREVDGESVVLAKDQAARAEAIIAALPERTRAAYLMRRDQEMSFSEIGAALGVSSTRAHQLASAALRAMMEGLDDPDDPAPP